MSQLSLYLFGPPRLELDGNPVHIPRRKAMALLAYLAVSSQSHSRDALATLLWPENDQSSARAELRRTLSVLNRILGEGWLVVDRETARLTIENDQITANPFWLDVADFQGKLKVCNSHNHPPTVACLTCLPTLEEAIELYINDFMAGFSLKGCREYDEWQFFKREELRTKLTNSLVRLSSHYANALEYETAIDHAQRWLALDPLQEAAHRQLMFLFSQSGQRTAALRQYETCRQTLHNELGAETSDETKDLYQKIRASRLVSTAASRPKSNLPAQATPFIGRESELAEIQAKLRDDNCRLLTLLGPGGSGKTRLAIEAAGGLLDDFKHGVFFVYLAPLEDPTRIPITIAAALDFSFYEEGIPEAQLLDYLGNKEILLILDNFEHLLSEVSLVNKILNEAPKVKILATSRTSLEISSEHIFDVWGMAYPESPAAVKTTIKQYSAVKLFESIAKRRQVSFELSDENIPDVIRICDLVEGMPLGIVLAASWAKMLSPKEIATEIALDLAFLEKDLQDLPERQRGMRSVFNHSWRLLSDREQKILSALSVFRGGFTREAARAVARASLGDLMGLTNKSILHRVYNGRFAIHELLRQYAAEKLESDPATEVVVHGKHSDFYCQALAVWERELQGSQQVAALQETTVEIDNIQTAWNWAVENFKVKSLMGAFDGLCLVYDRNYQRVEGEAICRTLSDELTVTRNPEQPKMGSYKVSSVDQIHLQKLQTKALSWISYFQIYLGNRHRAAQFAIECLDMIDGSEILGQDTHFEKAVSLMCLTFTSEQKSRDDSKQLAEEALNLFKSLDEHWWVGLALERLGVLATSSAETIKYFQDSLSIRRNLGDLRGIADVLSYLANNAGLHGKFGEAKRFVNEARPICEKLSDYPRIAFMYCQLGSHLVWQGKFIEARSVEREFLETYPDIEFPHSRVALFYSIMGFPDQFMGEYEAARKHARQAIEMLRTVKHFGVTYFTALSIDILGRIELAEGSFLEAEKLFQESISLYKADDNKDNIDQALACLGFSARGLGQISQAQGHLYEALQVAIEAESYLSLTLTLPGIALLFADQGEAEQAVELYALAATQGIVANSKWFDDIAGDEIAEVAEGLPVEVAEAAKARGRGLDLWETAEGLLRELEELGWGNANP